MHSVIHSIPKVLNHSSINSKSKTSPNITHSKEFQISLSKLGKGETLGMIHLGQKFLSIYRAMKLDKKLSASKIQQWDRHRIYIYISKGI